MSIGGIQDIFVQWEQIGFFSYIIPFLLIFALVFGILMRMGLFKENKAVSAIIALAVGLMSLQFGFVPRFFSEIFPRFGVGLAVILVVLIFVGMFTDPKKPGLMYMFLGLGLVVAIVVFVQTSGAMGSDIGRWIQQSWEGAIGVILIIGILIAGLAWIIGGKPKPKEYNSPMFQMAPPPK